MGKKAERQARRIEAARARDAAREQERAQRRAEAPRFAPTTRRHRLAALLAALSAVGV